MGGTPAGTRTGVNTSHDWTLIAEDADGVKKVLVGMQGEPSFGDELPDQYEQVDVYERRDQLGRSQGQEQPLPVSGSVMDCAEVRDFVNFVLFRGPVYGAGGSKPTKSVDTIGGKAVKLIAQCEPPDGVGEKIEYAKAYFTCTRSTATPNTTWAIAAECFGRKDLTA
jgi:hypothetical protein